MECGCGGKVGVYGGESWVGGGVVWLTVVSSLLEFRVTRAQGVTRFQQNGHLLWQFGTRSGRQGQDYSAFEDPRRVAEEPVEVPYHGWTRPLPAPA